jgi:uncharacterized coiled-coil protein SlyX
MFIFKSDNRLQNRITELEAEVASYQKAIDKINADALGSSFSFDFTAVKVFSIERNFSDNRPVTIIGYVLNDSDTDPREWYLYCNQDHHEKLVDEFNKTKKSK